MLGGFFGLERGNEPEQLDHCHAVARSCPESIGSEKTMRICFTLIALTTASAMLTGCGQAGTPVRATAPTQTGTPARVAAPTQSGTLTQAAVPTPPLANVTCNELSFYLDPSLGSDTECKAVPESSSSDIPMDIFTYPAHTELIVNDYPLTHTQAITMIYIYPVDRFSELLPDVLPRRVADLQSFISGGALSSPALPFLPPMPLIQVFFSQETVLSFDGGQGVRYITQYNEIDNTINNKAIFYTFQGLTEDGMYWVTVTLPISNPILPDNNSFPPPPEGFTEETWSQNYDSYVREVKSALDVQAPGSFSPTINILDDLVRSINIRR